MIVNRQIVVTPEEALEELIRLCDCSVLKPLLDDPERTKKLADRMRAVLDFYREYNKPAVKKKAVRKKRG